MNSKGMKILIYLSLFSTLFSFGFIFLELKFFSYILISIVTLSLIFLLRELLNLENQSLSLKREINSKEIELKDIMEDIKKLESNSFEDRVEDSSIYLSKIIQKINSTIEREPEKIIKEVVVSENSENLDKISNKIERIDLDIPFDRDRLMEAFKELKSENLEVSNLTSQLNLKIDDIQSTLNLIEDVASQSELLSLNATIESARFGEDGKGFAIVASEMNKLSSKTEQATKDIKSIISFLTQEINYLESTVESLSLKLSGVEELVVDKCESRLSEFKDELENSIEEIKGCTQS